MSSSIRELARHTGLSIATVSLALRGKGRISAATQKKVREAAQLLDYQATPILSKAFAIARQPANTRYRETLAFLLEYPMESAPDYQKLTVGAAQERARSMGYNLECFAISGAPAQHRQLSRILHARGIRGIIIHPRLEHRQPRLVFEWKHFAAVEIERTLWSPRNLHHVEIASYHKVIESIHLLKKAGYSRIGMAVEPEQIKHRRGIFNAAFLVMQLRLPIRQRIPPLSTFGPWDEKTFRRWMKKYQPDVLFIHDAVSICAWLQRMGMRVPEDISLFCENAKSKEFTGLTRDYCGIGRSAVEMLSLLLETGDLGFTDNPRCWLVDEHWQLGTSLSRPIMLNLSSEEHLKEIAKIEGWS